MLVSKKWYSIADSGTIWNQLNMNYFFVNSNSKEEFIRSKLLRESHHDFLQEYPQKNYQDHLYDK